MNEWLLDHDAKGPFLFRDCEPDEDSRVVRVTGKGSEALANHILALLNANPIAKPSMSRSRNGAIARNPRAT